MQNILQTLWLEPSAPFPNPQNAQSHPRLPDGLIAMGADLRVQTLIDAYSKGIFPWFNDDDPILWWSPQPRMVLRPVNFRLHRSLRKTLQHYLKQCLEIRMDTDFTAVIEACASSKRTNQSGTWIVKPMIEAYCALHEAGYAHSVEVWFEGVLIGGLYCVNIGHALFGESMFSRQSNASKIALAALVSFCIKHQINMIDCQQQTEHLASLGAFAIDRSLFLKEISLTIEHTSPLWRFSLDDWQYLFNHK